MAVGGFNDSASFQVSSYVSAEFEQDGDNYTTSVEMPRNTIDTAMSVALPVGLTAKSCVGDQWFEDLYVEGTYAVWRAETPMSEISGSVVVNLVGGGTLTVNYAFV